MMKVNGSSARAPPSEAARSGECEEVNALLTGADRTRAQAHLRSVDAQLLLSLKKGTGSSEYGLDPVHAGDQSRHSQVDRREVGAFDGNG